MELLLRLILILGIFTFVGCASDGSFQWPTLPAVGVEDAETGKLKKGCKPIPERNVQRCEKVKNGERFFVEIPLPKKEEAKKESPEGEK